MGGECYVLCYTNTNLDLLDWKLVIEKEGGKNHSSSHEVVVTSKDYGRVKYNTATFIQYKIWYATKCILHQQNM